ncbi:TPA: Cof-type HAD-IIB family hydrolase [Streptococcus suis]|nr:HAD family hydrolase [Streptococcus suis]
MTYKKMIATDMDGTFLREDHSFDKERLRRVLEQFKQAGYLFVVASGRSMQSLQMVFESFEEDMAFVAENGALVHFRGQAIYEDDPIPAATYLTLIAQIANGKYAQPYHVTLSGKECSYMLQSMPMELQQELGKYYLRYELVEDFSQVKEDIIKLNIHFDASIREEAQAWINQNFDNLTAVTTGFTSVDIILSGVHKALGLDKLCQHFGLTKEDVIAFGDNQNDIEMLEFAGLSLVTSNAQPTAKAVADQVIGHCNDDAVLNYMEELVNGY